MKFKMPKNFLSFLKPILIVSLILVVVSSVVFGIFGFNKGLDFTGGTQLVVDYVGNNTDEPANLTQEESKIANEIGNIIKSKGIRINSFQVQGDYSNKSFVITFKDVGEEKLNSIRLEINNKFNTFEGFSELNDSLDITRNTTHIDGFLSDNIVLTTISTLLFALIICMIYGLFRVKTSGALTIVLSGVLSVVLTCCFVLLSRIEINTYFFVALGVIELFSIFLTVDTLFNLKYKQKDATLSDKNNHELVQIVLEQNFTKNLIVGLSAIVLALIVGIFGVLNILELSLVVIVGIVVSFCINLFVIPAFWAEITKKRELVRPAKVETNDKDNNAEVIEIKE